MRAIFSTQSIAHAKAGPESPGRPNHISKRTAPLRRLLHPIVDRFLGLLLLVAVALLQAAGEFLALAVDEIDVVVGELAPLLAQLAFRLGPVAFDLVPVHRRTSTFMNRWNGRNEPRP